MPKYPQNMCCWDFKPTFDTSSKESKWWYIHARPMCALFCQGASGEVVSIISEIDFCSKYCKRQALWSSDQAGRALSITPEKKLQN